MDDKIRNAKEKQNKLEQKRIKKRKKKVFITGLILVVLIIALLLLMKFLGIGFGGGKGQGGDGNGETDKKVSSVASQIETNSEDDSSEAPKTVVTLKISGSTYIYKDSVYTLDKFKSDVLSVMDKDSVVIELEDDNAVANAVENMHSMLDSEKISYVDKIYNESSSKSSKDSSEEDSLSDSDSSYKKIKN